MTDDATLRDEARRVLEENRRGAYTVPALGLYPYQWCWDTGPIALGWAALGEWDQAWLELEQLLSAQWANGFVPHIVFWQECDDYFPGPEVWGARAGDPHDDGAAAPATTGITQPPLPISAAVRLFASDPDRTRAHDRATGLWPRLAAWIEWLARTRRGPHGALVVVHPWETGMDNSPAWDEPLAATPRSSSRHLDRRDVATVAAAERPTTTEYRHYLGIVTALRDAGWDAETQAATSPFVVEDPGFTAVTARAAADLAELGTALGRDDHRDLHANAASIRAGLEQLWDADARWYRAYDVRTARSVGPRTVGGLLAGWAGGDRARGVEMWEQVEAWRRGAGAERVRHGVPSTDPGAAEFDPVRYWRGPVWVLTNWMVADGWVRWGSTGRAQALRDETRALVAAAGNREYYDPLDGRGIGGVGFSWTAALTLAWLTDPTL
jgi:hypothetical protein